MYNLECGESEDSVMKKIFRLFSLDRDVRGGEIRETVPVVHYSSSISHYENLAYREPARVAG